MTTEAPAFRFDAGSSGWSPPESRDDFPTATIEARQRVGKRCVIRSIDGVFQH
ncbi:hypothetical protein L810_1586 [Burkholderia sp. AU4i]|nr:hypothetical protein L810_1586 [Burkholderia sp. AU4i]